MLNARPDSLLTMGSFASNLNTRKTAVQRVIIRQESFIVAILDEIVQPVEPKWEEVEY